MATTKPFLLPPQPTSPPARPGPTEPKLAPSRAPPPTPTTGGWNPLAALVEVPGALWRVGRRRWALHGHRRGAARARGGVDPWVPAALPLRQVPGPVFEFTQACGICVGTPVWIRGVAVGSIVRIDSSLHSIDAYAEVHYKLST